MKNSSEANAYYKRQADYAKLAFTKDILMPRRYVLVLTNLCNLKCTFCVQERKKKSEAEISHWGEYQYVLVNDNLQDSGDAIKNILIAERMKRCRQPKLVQHVRNLQKEYAEYKKSN